MCKYYRVYLCAFITVLHYFHFSDMDYSLIVSITGIYFINNIFKSVIIKYNLYKIVLIV